MEWDLVFIEMEISGTLTQVLEDRKSGKLIIRRHFKGI